MGVIALQYATSVTFAFYFISDFRVKEYKWNLLVTVTVFILTVLTVLLSIILYKFPLTYGYMIKRTLLVLWIGLFVCIRDKIMQLSIYLMKRIPSIVWAVVKSSPTAYILLILVTIVFKESYESAIRSICLPLTIHLASTNMSFLEAHLPLNFTGRDSEIAEISNDFLSGHTKFINILGEEGVGNTTLAFAAAQHMKTKLGFEVAILEHTPHNSTHGCGQSVLHSTLSDFLEGTKVKTLIVIDKIDEIDEVNGIYLSPKSRSIDLDFLRDFLILSTSRELFSFPHVKIKTIILKPILDTSIWLPRRLYCYHITKQFELGSDARNLLYAMEDEFIRLHVTHQERSNMKYLLPFMLQNEIRSGPHQKKH